MAITTTPLLTSATYADLDALRIAVLAEQERRRTIASAAVQAAAIAFGGVEYRNKSGAWLPITTLPGTPA